MTVLFGLAPALPLHAAGKYVAGAYVVFAVMLVVYVGIMTRRLRTNQRELAELRRLLDERDSAAAAAHSDASQPPNEPEQVA